MNVYKILVGKPEAKITSGRNRHRWEDSIKMQWDFFSSPQRPDRFWSLPSLLSEVYRRSSSKGIATGVLSWPLTFI